MIQFLALRIIYSSHLRLTWRRLNLLLIFNLRLINTNMFNFGILESLLPCESNCNFSNKFSSPINLSWLHIYLTTYLHMRNMPIPTSVKLLITPFMIRRVIIIPHYHVLYFWDGENPDSHWLWEKNHASII